MAAFDTLEARINTVTLAKLNNVTVLIDGAAVDGVFDDGYMPIERGIGFSASAPSVKVATSSVPASPVGTEVVVNGTTYVIAEHEPDGTGISLLILERAP